MSDPADRATIDEAEGYLALGMFQEAWDFIDTIPDWATYPALLRVRMHAAMGLNAWEIAETLAVFLGGDEAHKQMAGKVLHELAAIHAGVGDIEHARELVRLAVRIYPEQRAAIIEDAALEGLF